MGRRKPLHVQRKRPRDGSDAQARADDGDDEEADDVVDLVQDDDDDDDEQRSNGHAATRTSKKRKKKKQKRQQASYEDPILRVWERTMSEIALASAPPLRLTFRDAWTSHYRRDALWLEWGVQLQQQEREHSKLFHEIAAFKELTQECVGSSTSSGSAGVVIGLELNAPAGTITLCTFNDKDEAGDEMKIRTDMTLQELFPDTNPILSAHLVNLVQNELLVLEIVQRHGANGDQRQTPTDDCDDSLAWRVGIAWQPYRYVHGQAHHHVALPARKTASCHRSMHHVMIWLLRNARGDQNQCEYPYWKEIDVLYDRFASPIGSESIERVAFDIHDIYACINSQQQLQRDTSNFEEASATNLLPTLRPYQKAAVSWMLSRENPEANVEERSMLVQFPGFGSQQNELSATATSLAYDPFTARFFSSIENDDGGDNEAALHNVAPPSFNLNSVRGGILADEMGLGKTVEVITLVLCNPWAEARPILQSSHQVPLYDSESKAEEEEGEESTERDCICGSTEDEERGWVQCDFCETWHHQLCTGYSAEEELFADRTHEHPLSSGSEEYTASLFMCFHCQATENPEFACKTTLIVSPEAIHNQWETELKRHVKPGVLKLLRYPGVKALRNRLASLRGVPSAEWKILANAGLEISSYDVVLTTYEALSSDLYHLPTDLLHERRSSTRQKRKKYAFVASPLIFLKFWRVCMDEAQVGVENAQLQAALTVAKIKAEMKWVVTGTPFSTQVGDLFGCFKFLRLAPYDDETLGSQLFKENVEKCFLRGAIERVLDILLWDGRTNSSSRDGGGLLWRTAKNDVLSQLNLPDQVTELIWCRFSDVERHFYDEQEKVIVAMVKEYQRQSQCALDNGSGNSLSSVDVTEKIWHDLLVLRQICCHPQVGSTLSGMFSLRNGRSSVNGEANGSSGAGGGGVLSMDEFLHELILKCKRECEEGQRKYLAAQNGLASLYLITHETPVAVLKYLSSIQVIKGNWDLFRADLLPRLHILENLARCVRTIFKIEVDESSGSSGGDGEDQGAMHTTTTAASSSNVIRRDLSTLESEMTDISNNPKENSLLPNLPALAQAVATDEAGEVSLTETASVDAIKRECEVLDVCASKIKKFYLYQVEASHSAALHSFEAIAKAVEEDSLSVLARSSSAKKRRVLCSSSLWWVTALSTLEQKAPEQVLLFADRLRARLLSFGTKWSTKFCNSFSTIAGFQMVFLDELEELSKKRAILYEKLRKMSTKPPTKKDVELSGNCKKCRDARDGPVCDHCKLYKELEAFKQHFLGIDSAAASASESVRFFSLSSSRRGERNSAGIYDVEEGESAAANPVNTSSLLLEVFREIASSTRTVMAARDHFDDDEADRPLSPQEGMREELEFWTQVQKEWNAAKKLFQVQHQRLGGLDELEMATMQIRVRLEGEQVTTAAEKLYKLQEHEVPVKFASFESERVLGELEMREKLARLRFLLQLEKQRHRSNDADDQASATANGNSEEGEGVVVPTKKKKRSACAICLEEMENERVMLPCAHSFCKNCMKTLSNQHKATASIKCPTCRRMCNVARAVMVVEKSNSPTSNGKKRSSFTQRSARPMADAHIQLQRGGYGSKIDAILRRVLSLSQQNAQVKCLLFTQWQDMMSIVATHLKRNGVMCFTYTTKKNFHRVMQQFKMHADPCVLALPFKVGANGLNLVEATEVLLVEPLLNTSIEAQAINRVHRIGQTKQTRVHRLVVDNSVEERIYWLGQKKKRARGSFTGADATEDEAKEEINSETADADTDVAVAERAPTKKEKEQLTLNDLHVLLDGKMGSNSNGSNDSDEEGEWHPFWQEQVLLNNKVLTRIEAKLFVERLHAAECRANGQSAEEEPQTHLFDQELNLVVANELVRLQHATALEQSQSISTELLAFHRARLEEELDLWRSATSVN